MIDYILYICYLYILSIYYLYICIYYIILYILYYIILYIILYIYTLCDMLVTHLIPGSRISKYTLNTFPVLTALAPAFCR